MKPTLLAGLLLVSLPAAGQNWQTITQSRRVGNEDHLRVHVEHAAGDLRIRPGAAGQLYRMALRYDEDTFTPSVRYIPTASILRIDIASRRNRDIDWDNDVQALDLTLAPDLPLDLAVEFGAARAELDLGGLTIRTLSIETGASETRLSFATPNGGECTRLNISVGAAQFTATRLGNARCRRVTVEAGVGDLLLDFTGDMPETFESAIRIEMGLGGVEIHVPEHAGVQLNVRRFLVSLDQQGFIRRGDSWVTPNWDEATRKLTIDIRAALGGIEIVRVPEPR